VPILSGGVAELTGVSVPSKMSTWLLPAALSRFPGEDHLVSEAPRLRFESSAAGADPRRFSLARPVSDELHV
jgi:hypothetical protein